ncbi:hypothetical protein [Nocardioides sp. BYT-33-1]|uniref:hypothetical protein n=1 Tax=Nocardioides sp. BYT-33-1 TaxID=3416952 RepID=UPI003F53A102
MPASTTEYIRVRQVETGHELSVPRSHAETTGGYEVLDELAVDSAGRPLPPKYRTGLAETVARATGKRTGRGQRTTTPAAPAADSQPLTDGQQADTTKETA